MFVGLLFLSFKKMELVKGHLTVISVFSHLRTLSQMNTLYKSPSFQNVEVKAGNSIYEASSRCLCIKSCTICSFFEVGQSVYQGLGNTEGLVQKKHLNCRQVTLLEALLSQAFIFTYFPHPLFNIYFWSFIHFLVYSYY